MKYKEPCIRIYMIEQEDVICGSQDTEILFPEIDDGKDIINGADE